MKSFFRSVLAVVVGIMVAMTIIGLTSGVISPHVFPLPEGVDPNDMDALKKFMPEMPVGAFLVIMAGWSGGAFLGGFVAAWIAGRARFLHAGVIGAVVLAGTIAVLLMLPHPLWVNITAPILPIPASLMGAFVVPRRATLANGS